MSSTSARRSANSLSSNGGRRRAKSPVPLATLLRGSGSSSGPEPSLAILHPPTILEPKAGPMAMAKHGRSFANHADKLKELPDPAYFNRVRVAVIAAHSADYLQIKQKSTSSLEDSKPAAAEDISPFSFPDDPAVVNGTGPCMLDDDGWQDELMTSEEFQLDKIIAQRSRGGLTDDQIKEKEIQRMKDSRNSSLQEKKAAPGSRQQESAQRARQTTGSQVSDKKPSSAPSPRQVTPPRGVQKEEDSLSNDSLHRIIAEHSHMVDADELIKQQEINRMKASMSSVPDIQRKPPSKKPQQNPHTRRGQPEPLPQSKKPQPKPQSTIPHPRAQIPLPTRVSKTEEEADPLSTESLHRIIAERSRGVDTDDQIKQREIDRMKESMNSRPEEDKVKPQQKPQRGRSPRPQVSPSTRVSKTKEEADPLSGRLQVPTSREEEDNELQRAIDASLRESEVMDSSGQQWSRSQATGISPGGAESNEDELLTEEEGELALNRIIVERANAATAETLADADSKMKLEATNTYQEKNNGEDVNLLGVAAWRSQQPDDPTNVNSDLNPTSSDSANNNATTTTNIANQQVQYNSRGQAMIKNKLPPGAKRPGAYSGAPGTGYNRVSSLRCPDVLGSMPDQDSTANMTDASSVNLTDNTTANVQSAPNGHSRSLSPMEKKKKNKKSKMKAMVKFVGRLRR